MRLLRSEGERVNGFLQPLIMGLLALVASYVFTGCRFGNHTGQPLTTDPSGWYNTEPKSLLLCTDIRNDCKAGAVDKIPYIDVNTFTDPVALSVTASTGSGVFANFNLDKTSFLPVDLSNDKTFQVGASGTFSKFFQSTDCAADLAIEGEGSLTIYSPKKSDSNGNPISGRVAQNVVVIQSLVSTVEDGCANTMQLVADCFHDETKCQGGATNSDLHQYTVSVMGPYIDAGVIAESDIPNVRSLIYQAKYE